MSKKPRNPSPNTSGLKPNKSPDCTTKPIQISVMLEQDQLDYLDSLEGSRSYNIRCCIRHCQEFD